jgi:anti-sigma factor RsiW
VEEDWDIEGSETMTANAVFPPCRECEALLHGLADGELDAANAASVEEHLEGCPDCAAAFKAILEHKALLRDENLRFRAPDALRDRLSAAFAKEGGAPAAPAKLAWAGGGAASGKVLPRHGLNRSLAAFSAMALAASLALFVSTWSGAPSLDEQLVASHIRSLLASHLTDVPSSDQHTVKPWFHGKLDFAPPVPDLQKENFELIGGRLDYAGGAVVPSLVYKRHGHVINLFIWPAGKKTAATRTMDGYHVLAWTHGGFDYAAVSDLNATELGEFKRAVEAALSQG